MSSSDSSGSDSFFFSAAAAGAPPAAGAAPPAAGAAPPAGMEASFFVIGMLYAGVGLLVLVADARPRQAAIAAGAALVLLSAAFPFGAMQSRHLEGPVELSRYSLK